MDGWRSLLGDDLNFPPFATAKIFLEARLFYFWYVTKILPPAPADAFFSRSQPNHQDRAGSIRCSSLVSTVYVWFISWFVDMVKSCWWRKGSHQTTQEFSVPASPGGRRSAHCLTPCMSKTRSGGHDRGARCTKECPSYFCHFQTIYALSVWKLRDGRNGSRSSFSNCVCIMVVSSFSMYGSEAI